MVLGLLIKKMKTNQIIQGDALKELKKLPDESIDCVMTSPPYWALRDYKIEEDIIWDYPLEEPNECYGEHPASVSEHDWNIQERYIHRGSSKNTVHSAINRGGLQVDWKTSDMAFCRKCGAWKGQFGLEPTFDLYIKHLCNIFDEVKRILKKNGTCFVNLGDSYAGQMGKKSGWTDNKLGFGKQEAIDHGVTLTKKTKIIHQLPQKCLICIPDRFRIEMVNRGWILRNKIIWYKRSCMPSSANDRFTIDFEDLMFFTKSKKYFFEQQYEDTKAEVIEPRMRKEKREVYSEKYNDGQGVKRTMSRNVRCVWPINPDPFSDYICNDCGYYGKTKLIKEREGYFGGKDKDKRTCPQCGKEINVSHFAIYPEELCEIPIRAGCPEFICKKCGIPKLIRKVGGYSEAFNIRVRDTKEGRIKYKDRKASEKEISNYDEKSYVSKEKEEVVFGCNCNLGFTSGIVLDPFFVAGTTGLAALKQNKKFMGIELNPMYVKISEKRLKPFLEQGELI